MNTSELGIYYADLLTIQYIQKPKARADVFSETKGLYVDDLASQVRDAFDLDTAIGSQLDILAKYVGAVREIPGQVGTDLSDADLLSFIKFKIIQNNCNHSNKAIDDLMYQFFGTSIRVFDNQDMTMAYIFSEAQSALLEALQATNSLPKPAGVATIVTVLPDYDKVYGFGRYVGALPSYIYGFGTYGGLPSGATWGRYT